MSVVYIIIYNFKKYNILIYILLCVHIFYIFEILYSLSLSETHEKLFRQKYRFRVQFGKTGDLVFVECRVVIFQSTTSSIFTKKKSEEKVN